MKKRILAMTCAAAMAAAAVPVYGAEETAAEPAQSAGPGISHRRHCTGLRERAHPRGGGR